MHSAANGGQLPGAYLPGFQAPQQHQQLMHWEWAQQQQVQLQSPDVPLISQMLIREADAWRALLGLHGSLMHLSTELARSSIHSTQAMFEDDQAEAFEQREASYIASVGHLSSQCDLLVAEAVKLRGLRKAQAQLRTEGLRDVLHQHANEALAVGETHARSSVMSVASATSEVRQAAQQLRTQLQQGRALLQAAAELRALGPMPTSAVVVMGVQDGASLDVAPVATVLQRVYQRGALSDETLCTALWHGDLPPAESVSQQRTFQRRAGDHVLQQQLVVDSGSGKAPTAIATDER
jgi:hypothetical protein